MGVVSHLVCSSCSRVFPPKSVAGPCSCGGFLLTEYPLDEVRRSWLKQSLAQAAPTLWRYAPLLPAEAIGAVSLSEGWTPIFQADRIAEEVGAKLLWIKDEGRNPTGSAADRAMSVAVTMARKAGLHDLALRSSGNSGVALAAYCAAASMSAHVFAEPSSPQNRSVECAAYGASVLSPNMALPEKWPDVSGFREPYGLEGWKTLGFEIAEQFGWELPDVVLYPCGEVAGLVGMWKGFAELETIGWIPDKRPRMIGVQPESRKSIAAASQAAEEEGPATVGTEYAMDILRQSGGTAFAVSGDEMAEGALLLWQKQAICASPEAGASVAAVRSLIRMGAINPKEKILLCNTSSGLTDLKPFVRRFPGRGTTEHDKLGGLITPR